MITVTSYQERVSRGNGGSGSAWQCWGPFSRIDFNVSVITHKGTAGPYKRDGYTQDDMIYRWLGVAV